MERTVVAEGLVTLKEAGMVKVVGEMVTTKRGENDQEDDSLALLDLSFTLQGLPRIAKLNAFLTQELSSIKLSITDELNLLTTPRYI